MSKSFVQRHHEVAMIVGALCMATAASAAQKGPATPDASASGGLEEIVVTAERREASTQKTAQAITAVTAQSLKESGVTSAAGLSQVVPGVDVNLGGGFSQIRIRGVGGGVVNNFGEPGVAYSVGGVYIAQPYGGNAAYYDLSRVEVLKGPQGTLYGRNSTAGAINVVPNRPELTRFYGEASLQVGNYSDFEPQVILNAPLGDKVAARLAISTINHDGYFSNGQSDAKIKSGRLQFLFQPTDGTSIVLLGDLFEENGKGPGDTPLFPGTNANGVAAIKPGSTGRYLTSDPFDNLGANFVYSTGFPPPNATFAPYGHPKIDHKQTILSADVESDLGFANLSFIPAYVTTKVNDNLANFGYTSDVFTDAKQTSVEARLASKSGGSLQWVAGAYYFDHDNNSTQTFLQRGLGYITLGTPKMKTTSKAFFGQGTYSVTDTVRLTAGLRYTSEDKSVRGATVAPGVPAFLCPNYIVATGTGYSVTDRCSLTNTGDLSFSNTSWKVGAEYDVAAHSMLYGNVSTGFRAGGFNPGAPPNTFPPEKLTAFEVGSKNEFAEGTARVNVSAFYWNYSVESNPVFGPINPIGLAFVVVPGSSHIYGAEIETAFKASSADTISFNALYQHAKYVHYSTLAIPFIGIPATVYDGTDRTSSPDLSGNASYDHSFLLASGGKIDANLNAHFESSSLLALQLPVPEGYRREGFVTGNISVTYTTASDKFSLGAFVNNVTDEWVGSGAFTSTTTGNVFQQSAATPRIFGLRANVKF